MSKIDVLKGIINVRIEACKDIIKSEAQSESIKAIANIRMGAYETLLEVIKELKKENQC